MDPSVRTLRQILIALTLLTVGVLALVLFGDRPGVPGRLVLRQPVPTTHLAASPTARAAAPEASRQVPQVLLAQPPRNAVPLESPFVAVADQVVPAVVSIEGIRTMVHPQLSEEDRDLWRRLFPHGGGAGDEIEVPSEGSGFLFDPQGFILTNDHVISGAETITVHLSDGRTYPAHLMGTDPGTDVAVIKVDPKPGEAALPVLPLGNSDEMRVGDWAIAVGNPLGELESTFTVGVISATGRNNLRIAGGGPVYQDFVQTDASINFGNSGGPLVNLRGEVIGINSAINPTGQGLGFAIPVNMAREVAVELIRTGNVRRGFLGIRPEDITDHVREARQLPATLSGVYVGDVEPQSPAELGGLRKGDVILEFDGTAVADVPQFRRIVADAGVGTEVTVRVHREGAERELHVTLALRPDTVEPPTDVPEIREEDWLRAQVEEITPESVSFHNLARLEGLVVTRLDSSGRGAVGGMRVGDVILAVNGVTVSDLDGFREALRGAISGDTEVGLDILRGANTLSLVIGRAG